MYRSYNSKYIYSENGHMLLQIAFLQCREVWTAKSHTVRLLGIIQSTLMMQAIIHKVLGAVCRPQSRQ